MNLLETKNDRIPDYSTNLGNKCKINVLCDFKRKKSDRKISVFLPTNIFLKELLIREEKICSVGTYNREEVIGFRKKCLVLVVRLK